MRWPDICMNKSFQLEQIPKQTSIPILLLNKDPNGYGIAMLQCLQNPMVLLFLKISCAKRLDFESPGNEGIIDGCWMQMCSVVAQDEKYSFVRCHFLKKPC